MDRKRSVRSRQGRYGRRSLFKRCKECTRKLIAFLFSNVGIIGLVVGFSKKIVAMCFFGISDCIR